ncbi:MAG: DUF2283 domain-containing protein [Caldilineaceae bacterium]|nr:DUF2283 domain-containing protein [Caldilineaceae bacterium]
MKITYDREVDALYIRFKDTTVTTKHCEEGIALDYDAANHLAGIEILDDSQHLDNMKLHINQEADALYLRLDDSPIIESQEVAPGIVLDYNEANQIAGVEMLHLSKRSPNLNFTTLELVIS